MTATDYHCKICGKGSVAYYDEACPIGQLKVWKDALCCDRCYDFRDSYMNHKRKIADVARALQLAKQSQNYKARADAEKKCRELFYRITNKIAEICSDYYRIQKVWDDDFVTQIMDKPQLAWKTLDAYHAGVRRLSKTQ